MNLDGSEGIWIYRNYDLRIEDTLNAAKDVETVAAEIREIVSGMEVTSYNVPFDLGKFLYHEPWNLKDVCSVPFDIMDLATKRVGFLPLTIRVRSRSISQCRRAFCFCTCRCCKCIRKSQ